MNTSLSGRSLRAARRSAFVLAAAFGASGIIGVAPAWGGAGTVTTVVTPLSTNVTYSIQSAPGVTALPTWVGYTVSIKNDGGNTVNAVRFNGKTSVTDSAESAVYSSVEGVPETACTASGPDIDCQFGRLRAGDGVSFAVFFKAPVKVNGVAGDSVNFTGTTKYAEGDGGPTSPPQNSIKTWAASSLVSLGTNNPLLVKSAVPKSTDNVTLFTGAGGVTKDGDRFATTVIVPPSARYTTAEILEEKFTTGCVSFVDCFRSTVTIPPPEGATTFSPYLTFILRQDKNNILKGTRIEQVVIKYTANNVVHTLGPCASPTTLQGGGIPCIAETKFYKSSRVPGWTAELDGAFQWTLINDNNGSFDLF